VEKMEINFMEEYEYHKGAVYNILPFEVFKRKFHLLNNLLISDPDGRKIHLDRKIDSLCAELGY